MGTLTMFRRFFLGSKQEKQSNKGRPKSVLLEDTAKNQIFLFHAYSRTPPTLAYIPLLWIIDLENCEFVSLKPGLNSLHTLNSAQPNSRRFDLDRGRRWHFSRSLCTDFSVRNSLFDACCSRRAGNSTSSDNTMTFDKIAIYRCVCFIHRFFYLYIMLYYFVKGLFLLNPPITWLFYVLTQSHEGRIRGSTVFYVVHGH